MQLFIRAKHWQLFAVMIATMVAGMLTIREALPVALAASMLQAFVVFGWICTVGIECNKKAPLHLRRSPVFMLAGLAFALVYMIVLSGIMVSMFNAGGPQDPLFIFKIFPLHLIAMICVFYCMGYAAKRMVTLEQNRKVSFAECNGPFFLFWFFPLGVWILQPQVNRLLAPENT